MRGLLKGLAFGAAMAAATCADAAVPQYFVTSVNEDQAVLLDLATRNKVGEIVTLDLIVLQRQPSTVTGQPTYWVDGMQEVDCANHRTRVMLISAYSLDRTRKISSPNAGFRPWAPNNAADTQAIEAFVCRNVRSAGIRPVSDLRTFQQQYFTGEAGLADRGSRAIEESRAALEKYRTPAPGPAPAQAPPRPSPPPVQASPTVQAAGATRYLVTSYDKDTAFILDRTQIKRSGNIVSSLNYKLDVKAKRLGANDIYWSEAVKEHDCVQHRVRYLIQAQLTLDRRNRIPFLPPMTTDWDAVNKNSDEAETEALVCTGKVGRTMLASGDDLGALQRAFFAYAASNEPSFAFGPAAARAAAAAAATGAASGPPFVITSYDKTSAEIVDRRTIKRSGQGASATTWTYQTNSSPLGGVVYNWAERSLEVDCGKHLHRRAFLVSHTANFSQHFNWPSVEFSAWDSNAGRMYGDLEALLCTGRAPPEDPVINALADFVAPYTAYARGSSATLAIGGAPAPRPTPQAQAAPPQAARNQIEATGLDLLLIEETPAVATIVNHNSRSRTGDIASIDTLALYRESRMRGGYQVNWIESSNELDCRQHRWRIKITMFHTLAMDHQEKMDAPKFGDWLAIDSNTAPFETYMCQGAMGPGYRRINDLQSYRQAFFKLPAPPALKAPVLARGDYLEGLVSNTAASIIKKSSIKRQGDVATYLELSMLPESVRYKDKSISWFETTWQVDCKGHRAHSRVDAYLNDNRTVRTTDAEPKFDPWAATKPGSYAQQLEQFVCLGRHASDFKPIDDVEDFRSEYLKAVAAGVFKD